MRRFLCEVATGQLDAPEYLDTVNPLLEDSLDSQVDTAKFIYSEAVKTGARSVTLIFAHQVLYMYCPLGFLGSLQPPNSSDTCSDTILQVQTLQ